MPNSSSQGPDKPAFAIGTTRYRHKHTDRLSTQTRTCQLGLFRILKIMQIKYSIQGGTMQASDWKKKVD